MDKNMECPMCNSSNFKEEDGYYVCQICGNKFPIKNNSVNDKSATKKKITPKSRIIRGILTMLIGMVFCLIGIFVDFFRIVSIIDGIILLVMGLCQIIMGLYQKHKSSKKK